MYNVKILTYPESVEYRIYSKSIETDKEYLKKDRQKWTTELDGNGERISYNPDTGEIRNKEDTDRCFSQSRNRSKQKIIEYARANKWEWFFTFTFNPDIVDSFIYDNVYNKLSQWLKDCRKRKCPDMKYLGVPEQHKSGRWHFHVLVSGIDVRLLGFTESLIKGIYNVGAFRYGFTTVSPVKDSKRVSNYISKYITKHVAELTQGRHRYIASRNLNGPVESVMYMSEWKKKELIMESVSKGGYYKQLECPASGGNVVYINCDTL